MTGLTPPTYGLLGLIRLDEKIPFSHSPAEMMSVFRPTPAAVRTAWQGDFIQAVSVLHTADARQEPGDFTSAVPAQETVEALAGGFFFGQPPGHLAESSWSQRWGHYLAGQLAQQGTAGLATMNGVWAGAAFDRRQRRAILARDAVGADTLYATRHENQIIFASDLQSFPLLGIDLEFDEQALVEFMHYLYFPAPRTIFKDVYAVLPGHALLLTTDSLSQEKYGPSRYQMGQALADPRAVEAAIERYLPQFEEIFFEAVRDSLPESGRIALFQSWGKDSSSLAIALSKLAPDRVVSITVGGEGLNIQEAENAAKVCQHLGLQHQVAFTEKSRLLEGVRAFLASQDQPYGDPATLPLALAALSIPDDASAVFDGSGNDYYFGWVKKRGSYRLRLQLQKVLPGPLWPMFLRLTGLLPADQQWTIRSWHHPVEETFVSWRGWQAAELARLWGRDVSFAGTVLWQRMQENLHRHPTVTQTEVLGSVWEPHSVFRKTLRLAHHSGRAVRFPFVDSRLAQFVNQLPQELQFQGETNKILLRAFLAKHLPDELIEKRKGSFSINIGAFMEENNMVWVQTLQDAGLWHLFPNWSKPVLDEMQARAVEQPALYAHRVYAVCLLATWVGAYRGNLPPVLAPAV